MNLVLDIAERLPIAVLLGVGVAAATISLIVAATWGGTVAVSALVLGVIVVLVSGGLLALRVHLARLPLELADLALTTRIDGHHAYGFRARLGRGRLMRNATAQVRFLPDHGDPIPLEPLMGTGERLLGPWTVVIIDRDGRCGGEGRFEVSIDATEGQKTWTAAHTYGADDIQAGRFRAPVGMRNGRLALTHDAWDQVRPPTLEDRDG